MDGIGIERTKDVEYMAQRMDRYHRAVYCGVVGR